MKTKLVWQCDDAGYLIGRAVADESPLEPGVFLIPFGAVATKPPHSLTAKQEWRWLAGAWKVVDARPTPAPSPPEQRLADFLKANPDITALLSR